MYRWVIRPLLFLLPAEVAHHFALGALRLLGWLSPLIPLLRRWLVPTGPELATRALGCTFATPVVLAAGFDKSAAVYQPLAALGFGAIEVGTVTAEPQSGNATPRLFRLRLDGALVNRMGFNNDGATRVARRLAQRHLGVVGVNIGKTKIVAEDDAPRDYAASAARLAPHADYLVVNVSSPNTPGLRNLQEVEKLRPLLIGVQTAVRVACGAKGPALLVKIAPDLADDDIDRVADLALELGLDGIIATNTTIARHGLLTPRERLEAIGAGGLSGAPLAERSLEVLRRLRRRLGNRLTLVASGGIMSAEDAWRRIRAGATLVQIYTAFVYEGPLLPRMIALGLVERLRAAGLSRIEEAVGADIDATAVQENRVGVGERPPTRGAP